MKKETKAETKAKAQALAKKEVLKLLGGGKGQLQIIGVRVSRAAVGSFVLQVIRGNEAHNITEHVLTLADQKPCATANCFAIRWGGDPRGGGYSDSVERLKYWLGRKLHGDNYAFEWHRNGKERRAEVIC